MLVVREAAVDEEGGVGAKGFVSGRRVDESEQGVDDGASFSFFLLAHNCCQEAE